MSQVIQISGNGVETSGNYNEVTNMHGLELQPPTLDMVASTLEADKNGKIIPTFTAMAMVINLMEISYDEFLECPMIVRDGVMSRFEDADYVNVAIKLESLGFGRVALASVKEVTRKCMVDNRYDSARNWINSLRWDGVDRCSDLFSRYFGVERSDYSDAVSQYLVTAMAGRVIRPGIKADMVPILVGSQGIGKTTAVKALAPLVDTFTEIDLSAKGDANLSRQLRGKLIGELGELRGLKTKDAESIKAWITRTHEEWTPKFVEFTKVMPRRCVFIGTTNEEEFLADPTGNRRWLPLMVNHECDVEGLERDRDQIWAQAATMFTLNDVMWQEAQRLAPEVHTNHIITEEFMTDKVADALNASKFFHNDGIRLLDVWVEMYGEDRMPSKVDERRMGDALRHLGYERKRVDEKIPGTTRRKQIRKWFKE